METNHTRDRNEEVMVIKNVLTKLIKAQEKGDWQTFSECFAQGVDDVHIGTDVDEYWNGWDEFETCMKEAFQDRKKISISEKNTLVRVSREGSVAWYSQLIDTCLESKLNPVSIEGFRHTGVMEKTHGQWRIVQSHYSLPVMVEKSTLTNLHATISHQPC